MEAKEAKQWAELFTALAEGKIIEQHMINAADDSFAWVQVDRITTIEELDNYRIKPTSKTRRMMKREDYIKEAYSIMQDVEEVADLLEDREEAELTYVQGKSSLAHYMILTLYRELTEEDKKKVKDDLFGDDVEKAVDKACVEFCKSCYIDKVKNNGCGCISTNPKECVKLQEFKEAMKGE